MSHTLFLPLRLDVTEGSVPVRLAFREHATVLDVEGDYPRLVLVIEHPTIDLAGNRRQHNQSREDNTDNVGWH